MAITGIIICRTLWTRDLLDFPGLLLLLEASQRSLHESNQNLIVLGNSVASWTSNVLFRGFLGKRLETEACRTF